MRIGKSLDKFSFLPNFASSAVIRNAFSTTTESRHEQQRDSRSLSPARHKVRSVELCVQNVIFCRALLLLLLTRTEYPHGSILHLVYIVEGALRLDARSPMWVSHKSRSQFSRLFTNDCNKVALRVRVCVCVWVCATENTRHKWTGQK